MTAGTLDDGRIRFLRLLDQLPLTDPRSDIDTASLVARFPALASVEVTELQLPGPHGAVPARRYVGENRAGRGLVWVHGGAFVAGGLDMPESHWVGMELASRGIPVLALDYRKALGGVHHPVLSDDILVGWLASTTDDALGIPVERVHLGGASAGANLVAGVTARLARDGQPRPASLILVYPVLHGVLPPAEAAAAAAAESIPVELRFTPEFMRAVNLNYVGDEQLLYDAVAFPANATVHGFPPTLLVNAEADDLRPSGEAFAARLEQAGVATTAIVEPGTVHGYLDQPGLPAAFATIDRMAAWVVGEHLTG